MLCAQPKRIWESGKWVYSLRWESGKLASSTSLLTLTSSHSKLTVVPWTLGLSISLLQMVILFSVSLLPSSQTVPWHHTVPNKFETQWQHSWPLPRISESHLSLSFKMYPSFHSFFWNILAFCFLSQSTL